MSTTTRWAATLPADTKDIFPLFVYGTLRPGEKLHSMIAAAVSDQAEATVSGFMLHNVERGQPIFPVMVHDPKGRKVHGTVLFVRKGFLADRTAQMELAAGYELKWVDVDITTDGYTNGSALAFIWPRKPLGWAIPSGDWTRLPSWQSKGLLPPSQELSRR